MSVAQLLRIYYIELRTAKDVECIELIIPGCRRSIQQQSTKLFREEFPQPLTVQGEAFSFSVHRKKWYSSFIPAAINEIKINVRDVLSNSREQEFQAVYRELDITIGLSPSVDTTPTPVTPTPSNINNLRPTTDELLNQCPRFRILVIGQSGVGKSTLINKAFGIEQATGENTEPGKANIEEELVSPDNDRFVLHDSKGFEPADGGNCDAVKLFIEDRKKREYVKDQLHAVWLCFRIPIPGHEDRLLEDGAVTFLKGGNSALQNIPTVVVLTKYDKLLTYMVMQREADPDAAAKVYLQTHCFGPITQFTGSTSLSCVAVSWHGQGRKELIDLTHQKVTETFKLQPDTPSPVSMVTSMAQRMLPRLKIEGSIDVGRLRYWRTLTTGANFGNHTITECLAVIYTDIVRVWNFNDPSQYLYSGEFRGLMAQLATTIDRSTTASHRPTRADTTGLICEDGPPPVFLPFVAGLGLVQWARETYPQLPNVHHMFMAYIVDLVHVLEILFTLTASNNEKKLTRNAINSAFGIYYESEMRRSTHHEITSSDYNIPSCDTVLEKIISLVRTSPIDDNDISRALGNIPLEYLGLDTEWLSNATDYLTQIISFQRAALKRTPPGHQGRFVSLVNLSNSLHERFTKGGSFADLDEIIAVRRAALECTPPTPSDQCTSLLNLADSLRDKYARLGVDADLAEAIKHAGTALVRCPPEHHASCRDFVTSCMKLKPGHWRASPPIIDSGAEPSEVKQVVRNIVTEIVKSLPLRLLNTYTGALCDRDAQISYFEDSFQYNKLLSSTQRGLEFELSVRKTAWEFFGYTTLSHRWGTREPLLRSIQGNNIYCVDGGEGFAKLRSFCALTFKHRYMWAWSDTCCIDKDNSEELQKTIGSMFSWYRQSALTIVHLSDVSSTSPLVDSVWFKRGWTLQELLASPRVLFYTQDWSPYMNSTSSNHKTDDAILTELQKVTRIEKLQLERFSPGVDDARLKLQWASTRCTTRPEDVAYSLFGIFQVSLPVDYGETAQDAIGRLLMEIVSRSGDVSILDWVGEASSFHSCFPASLTPYQTVPQIQSAPSELSIYNDVDLEQERKLYNTVAQLRPPRFVGGRLVLPCLVHQITKVKRLKTSSTTSNHDYEIDAFGLAILRRTLSSSLQEGSEGHLPYILIRPWNPKILHPRAHGYVPGSLLEWLRQPFDALLLESRPHNEYKRIASDCLINARLEDLASVLHSGWQTLEIV